MKQEKFDQKVKCKIQFNKRTGQYSIYFPDAICDVVNMGSFKECILSLERVGKEDVIRVELVSK